MKKQTITKLITVIAVMIAMFTVMSVVAFADEEASATVSSDVTSVARGEEITFSVSIEANDVERLGFLPKFDENVFEFVDINWVEGISHQGAQSGAVTVPGTSVKIAVFQAQENTWLDFSGEVLTFTLRAKTDAAICEKTVSVEFKLNGDNAISNVTGATVKVSCAPNAHAWDNASCTTAKTCTECGLVEGAALGHNWTKATCTAPKTCSACGATEGSALGHNWRAATCTSAKLCYACNLTEGTPIDHVYGNKSNTYVAEAGDCENPTVYYYSCNTCDKKGTTTYVSDEAPAHQWTSASCTAPRSCSVCGASDGVVVGHFWEEATCTEPKKCTECNETQGVALGHTYDDGVVTKEPTVSAEGEKTFTCSVCSNKKVESIAKLPLTSGTDNIEYSDLVNLFEQDLIRDFVVYEESTIKLSVLFKNEDGSLVYNEDGSLKVEEIIYNFSNKSELEGIKNIVESGDNKNLQSYDFTADDEKGGDNTVVVVIIVVAVAVVAAGAVVAVVLGKKKSVQPVAEAAAVEEIAEEQTPETEEAEAEEAEAEEAEAEEAEAEAETEENSEEAESEAK